MGVIKDVQTIFRISCTKRNCQREQIYSIYQSAGVFTGQLFREKLGQGSTDVTEQVNSWFCY